MAQGIDEVDVPAAQRGALQAESGVREIVLARIRLQASGKGAAPIAQRALQTVSMRRA